MARLENALSTPRARRLFQLKVVKATCDGSDSVGKCVKFTGKSGDRYTTVRADAQDLSKMPADGVIIQKSGTLCDVQVLGEMEGAISGLAGKKFVFVGDDGDLAYGFPPTGPLGYTMVQVMGRVWDDDIVFLNPEKVMLKHE